MININEILKKHNKDYVLHGANVMHSSNILSAIKEIVDEVLKEASESFMKAEYKPTINYNRDPADKQQILDVAKQVKYD